MRSGLNFFVNSQLKCFKQREQEKKKISGSIFLGMKATIPGTRGIILLNLPAPHTCLDESDHVKKASVVNLQYEKGFQINYIRQRRKNHI
jgi:hypothetical protein